MAKPQNRYKDIADRSARAVTEENLKLSFDYIDWDAEYFFFEGLTRDHYKKIFDCLAELTRAKEEQILKRTHPSLMPKPIFNTKNSTESAFPETVVEKMAARLYVESENREEAVKQATEFVNRAFEVRIEGKRHGRLHGFVWNNIFHLVWFDPAHNLYPTEGLTRPKDFLRVRSFAPDQVKELRERIEELSRENAELNEILEQQTRPDSSD
ncbi:MAG: hypothetical protein ACPGVO_14005 [Spirulinaceae cyanobacterium]